MQCEGKCHLKKQLDKEEKKEQLPANPIKEKQEIQLLFSENNFDISQFTTSIQNELIAFYSFPFSDQHIHAIFHPPKV